MQKSTCDRNVCVKEKRKGGEQKLTDQTGKNLNCKVKRQLILLVQYICAFRSLIQFVDLIGFIFWWLNCENVLVPLSKLYGDHIV